MEPNMGIFDKVVRILITIAVIVLYLTHQLSGIAAIVLLIVPGFFIPTSVTGFCPLYWSFHISTDKK